MSLAMESAVHTRNEYFPWGFLDQCDTFAGDSQATQISGCMTTLVCLRNQKSYLEDLLSKTATTLNALRDKQTRNERALSVNPGPRSKKKRIQQNRWRTDKTIKTCENEERVIMDCLRVCQNNINMLESFMNPYAETSSSAADCSWSASGLSCMDTESSATDIDWNGWADEGDISPFQRQARRPGIADDIAPEALLNGTGPSARKPPLLPPRSYPSVPPPPPNTARSTQCPSTLSPTAASFKPGGRRDSAEEDEPSKAMDRLSIPGLMASKRIRQLHMQQGHFSDAEISHLFRSLSEHHIARNGLGTGRHSSCPSEACRHQPTCMKATETMRRSITI